MLDVQSELESVDDVEVTMDRRRGSERRSPDADNRPEGVAGDRRKVQRRRQIDPTTCERDYSEDEIEFMQAMDDYKRASGRMFPTCSEILEVVRSLGYSKLGEEPSTSVEHEETTADVTELELESDRDDEESHTN